MADTRKRKLGWLAAITLAVGGLAACGEEVVTDTGSAPAVEASRGSDQHLYNQAAETAARSSLNGSDRHLYNQAAEIAAPSSVSGSDVHLYNQAAEIAAPSSLSGSDRHLYNQAAEIAQSDNAAVAAGTDGSPNVWAAGNQAAAAALGR